MVVGTCAKVANGPCHNTGKLGILSIYIYISVDMSDDVPKAAKISYHGHVGIMLDNITNSRHFCFEIVSPDVADDEPTVAVVLWPGCRLGCHHLSNDENCWNQKLPRCFGRYLTLKHPENGTTFRITWVFHHQDRSQLMGS